MWFLSRTFQGKLINGFREPFNNIYTGVAVYETPDDGNTFVFKDFNKAGECGSDRRRSAGDRLSGMRFATARWNGPKERSENGSETYRRDHWRVEFEENHSNDPQFISQAQS